MSNVLPQPDPVPNDTIPLWEQVIEDMKERDDFGRKKYNTPLQFGNGRNFLVDAYQEALDKCVYLKGAILQFDQLCHELVKTQGERDAMKRQVENLL